MTVEEYIAGFPEDIQKRLKAMRTVVRKAIPGAEETIKYGMPTYVLNGNILSFGAYKAHIGLYPIPSGSAAFTKAIEPYRAAKSTLQFPHDKPIPLELVEQLAKNRIKALRKKKG